LKELPQCPEDDKQVNVGVLTSDEIEHCVKEFKLIDPFDEDLMRPARYRLTLGKEYAIGGIRKILSEESSGGTLEIPPFQVAIISTKETINLPRFLIARWNLDIKLVYRGLLWVGGPQVDPGWFGPLRCPLYNLSSKSISLRYGDIIASIDFVKTTPFKKGKTKEYPRPPEHLKFDDYETTLQSALFVEVREKILKSEREVERIGERVNRYLGSVFTVLAIMIAAISLVVTKGSTLNEPIPPWGWLAILFSVSALIFSIIPFLRSTLHSLKQWLKDP
jgi:deoxycytidine triphosphate deaminase